MQIRPLLLALVLAAATAATGPRAGAQSLASDAGGAGSLYGVFIPIPQTGDTASTATGVSSPIFASNAPSTDYLRTLVGTDYAIQPGDVYVLNLAYYQASSPVVSTLSLELFLEADYSLAVPLAGTVPAARKTLAELRRLVSERIREAVPVVHLSMWLRTPAVFQVFVTGAVGKPGYVTANAFMRVSDALQSAGGPIDGASVRTVRLRRDGTDREVDLLQFASGHDQTANPRLAPGDSVYVPVATRGVRVTGSVRYAGLYELVGDESLADLLELAGGLAAGAERSGVRVTRVDAAGAYTVTNVGPEAMASFVVQDGDAIVVPSATENLPMVTMEGALFGKPLEPGTAVEIPGAAVAVQIPFAPGLSVLAALERLGGPTPAADGGRAYVIRRSGGVKVPFDAAELWRTRDGKADLLLEPGDHVVVPARTLNISLRGEVAGPGIQTYVAGYTVADYVRAAGGITPTRGSANAIRLFSPDGRSTRVGLDYEPAPGDSLQVGKLPLAATTDFFGSYVFPVTSLVVGVLGVITTVLNFIDRVAPSAR